MTEKKKIVEYFERNRDLIEKKIKDLVARMVKEPTVNVPTDKLANFPFLRHRGEEYRVADIVKQEFENNGIPFEEFSRMPERPNIVATIGKGNQRSLLMPAHMDIVPPGDGWNTDPYLVIEKDGNLYGRGVLDNKGPLASIIVAAEILKELKIDEIMSGSLIVAALSDEEATDPDSVDYGIGYLLEEGLISPIFAIVPDIGENMKNIDIAEKGRMVVRITSYGRQAHGSTPELGVNAIFPLAKLITAIEDISLDYIEHPVLRKPSINLGEIRGGDAVNIVPGKCTIDIDIRTVPGMTRKSVEDKFWEKMEKITGEFVLEILQWTGPHAIEPDNELVRIIKSNSLEILNHQVQTFGTGGSTFAKTLNLHGVTAVGWGPGDDEAFHQANEFVEIKQLIDFSLLTCLVAIDLLS